MTTDATSYVVYSLNGGNTKTVLQDRVEAIALARGVQGKVWGSTPDGVETVVYQTAAHMAMVIKNQGRNPLNNQGYLDLLAQEATSASN